MTPEDAAFEEFLTKEAGFRQTLRQDIMPAAMKSMYWARRLGNMGHLGYKLLNARPEFEFSPPELNQVQPANPYFSGGEY